MSGSKPSRMPAAKQTSSHSVGRNLQRKLESNAADCDKRTQPRAEFRGSSKRDPYYVSYHGSYDPSFLAPKGFGSNGKAYPSTREQPYAARIPVPWIPSPKSGVVSGIDYSVRARNMPIIFIKQMKDKSFFIQNENGSYPYREAYKVLFPTGSHFDIEAKYRPNIGCVPTRFWNDIQVKTWSKLANHIGVQYSGEREYSFPKGCLGKTIAGSYYSSNKPWPRFTHGNDEGKEIFPFFDRPRTGRRSESARIIRSFKKIKRMEIKPFDFSRNLIVRREKTSREIRSLWRKSGMVIPYREYVETIPLCLCLNTRRPAPVPDIVLESLKRIAKSVTKLLPGSPWNIKADDPIQPKYTIPLYIPRPKAVIHTLRVYLSRDGNAYYTRSGNDGRENLLLGRKDLGVTKIQSIIKHACEIQSKIDSYLPEDPPPEEIPSLGDWGDW